MSAVSQLLASAPVKARAASMPGWLLPLAVLLCSYDPAHAGAFKATGHGNPVTGVQRLADSPTGSCGQCHTEDSESAANAMALWRENDNHLCYECHRQENISGVFPGQHIYQSSSHENDPAVVWPGPRPPARLGIDEDGKCLNCHDPHGEEDRDGLIPSLLPAREATLCLTCHDGDPASRSIAEELRKPYAHVQRRSFGRHSADEGGDPNRYAYTGGNRHVECSDCHNSHAIFRDSFPPMAPVASKRNARVGRVRVSNGPAGSTPTYEYLLPAGSGSEVLEYEICFKCHSSWTRQPPGESDLAVSFNPNNASHHAVEAVGNNPNIDPNAFVNGLSASSIIFCGDCHGSEDPSLRGPHGSQYPNILRRPYEANSMPRTVTSEELCFLCHSFETYAASMGSSLALEASRFNPPAEPKGHAYHVEEEDLPCFTCHDSHGSPRFGALIVTGRNPGLMSFDMRPSGGTCTQSCHDPRSYTLNYPR